MKKMFLLLHAAAILFLFISCNNSVDPLEFKDGYVLNCIIKTDTTFQIATISRYYSTNYLLQGERAEDYYISGCKIYLYCQNELGLVRYQFRDTTIINPKGSSSNLPSHFYYIKDFNPSIKEVIVNGIIHQYHNYAMTLVVTLPDGKKLSSYISSVVNDSSRFSDYCKKNPVAFSNDKLTFEIFPDYFNRLGYEKTGFNILTLPELIIKYEKYENGVWNKYQKVVPKYYANTSGGDVPVYPVISSDKTILYVNYDTLVIRQTLEKIGEENPDKKNIRINKSVFILDLLSYLFAEYLSAQQSFKAEFSYRIVPTNVTNIIGGSGIFGAMCSVRKNISIELMAKSLGFRTD